MNKEEILIAIREIQCRYSLPALEKNFTDKDYACKQYEKLVIHLANQQEEKDKEIERLNNIIKEVREYITNYESIDTIQQNEHLENNKKLDEKTMIEMVRRYMIVHDKLLEILDKGV